MRKSLLIFWTVGVLLSKSKGYRITRHGYDEEFCGGPADEDAEPCRGGFVDHEFMEHFRSKTCTIINGTLILRSLAVSQEELDCFNRVKKIMNGALLFEDNLGFESVSFLDELEEIDNSLSETPALQVSNNEGLTNVGLSSLKKIMSGGSGPIIVVSTEFAIPVEEQERFHEITGGRFEMIHEEEEDGYGILLIILLVIAGVAVVLILVLIISFVILKKEMHRKREEAKPPELVASGDSKDNKSGDSKDIKSGEPKDIKMGESQSKTNKPAEGKDEKSGKAKDVKSGEAKDNKSGEDRETKTKSRPGSAEVST
nr:unnamed protein product [Haemonchus contortus]